MKSAHNIHIKFIPFIMAIILPSIDYVNNDLKESVLDAVIRWLAISMTLLVVWFLNQHIARRKPIVIVLVNLGFIGLLCVLVFLLNIDLFSIKFLPRIWLPTILFIAIQQTIQSIQDKETLITENLTLKSETYKAELQNLRNQINPHFLFNTLTTLQTLIRQNPTLAEGYLIKLSDFYRKILLYSKADKITLQDELEFIESYIFLLQSRFENGLQVEIKHLNKALQHHLPIFALQLLIENCIKHNVISDENPLKITIFQNDETNITVQNNLQPKLKKEPSTQTGLSNLAQRYELLGITNGVEINQDINSFSVTIKLF